MKDDLERLRAENERLLAAMRKPVLRERPCTCHPDDNPPKPCAKRYALSECKAQWTAGGK